MDDLQRDVLRRAAGMKVFAGTDETFILGEWRAWERACYKAGQVVPPEQFKKEHKKVDDGR